MLASNTPAQKECPALASLHLRCECGHPHCWFVETERCGPPAPRVTWPTPRSHGRTIPELIHAPTLVASCVPVASNCRTPLRS